MSAVKILVIPGSLRSGSFNAKLAAVAAHALAQQGADVTRIALSDGQPQRGEELLKDAELAIGTLLGVDSTR